MKYFLAFCLLLIPLTSSAEKLNYIEAHLLRLSSQQNPVQWILPFNHVKNPASFESNLMLAMEKDTYSLYQDIKSKDGTKIQNKLEESFGKPYDLSAKFNVGVRYNNISQYFSTNLGAVLLVTDPVFPELDGFLYHDYTASTAMLLKPFSNLIIKPQLSYGIRKILLKQFSVGDLVDKSLNVNFEERSYIGFLELNLMSMLKLDQWGEILFQLNSYPIKKTKYDFWDSFLGYKTPDFIQENLGPLSEFYLFGGYSPFYGGHYDVSRTYKVGFHTGFWDFLGLDLFSMDDFYPGSILQLRFKYLTLEMFTFERAYDDFGNQKSRQYGFNLKIAF